MRHSKASPLSKIQKSLEWNSCTWEGAGALRFVEDDSELLEKLRDRSYPGKVERAILFQIDALDVNCPQHIHKRFTHKQVAPVIEQLKAKIAELEARLAEAKLKEV